MGIQFTIRFAFLSFPFLLFVFFTILSQHCFATDTLTQSQPISVGQTLISSGQIFEFSFLSPIKSSKQKLVYGFSLDTPPQVFIWNVSKPYWRSGPWDGSKFIGVLDIDHSFANGLNLIHDNQQGSVYITWYIYNTSYVQFMFLTPDGTLKAMYWDEQVKNPYVSWMTSLNPCDIYGVCGLFGDCNKNKSPNCECLNGSIPKSIEDWKKGNWAGGCVRKTDFLCQKNTTSLASSAKAQNDGFQKLRSMKLPDHYEYLYTEDSSGCQQWCLSNCSCVAYACHWN
ncbi:hypothetical protein ACSBR2_015883 [Camellia fascicularis]